MHGIIWLAVLAGALFTVDSYAQMPGVSPGTALVPADDIFYTTVTGPITLDVLANDNVAKDASIVSVSKPVITRLADPVYDPLKTSRVQAGPGASEGLAISNNTIIYSGFDTGIGLSYVRQSAFTYTVSDGVTNSTAAVVLIRGSFGTQSDSITIREGSDTGIPVLRNDFLLDANLAVSRQPKNGTATGQDGTIVYSPASGYSGLDSFEYTVQNAHGTATGTVTITIVPADSPHKFDLQPQTVDRGQTLTYDITEVDLDGPVGLLVFAIGGGPAGVDISGNRLTWTPTGDQIGTHTITVLATDPDGARDFVYIPVTVNEANQNPAAQNISRTIDEDGSITIRPPADDPDGHHLTITSVTGADMGAIVVQSSALTYIPDRDQNGQEILTYTVSDGHGGSDTGIITINITSVNDAPALALNDKSVQAQDTLNFTVIATDADGDDLMFGISDGPADATMTADGRFTWTPGNSDIDNHTLAVTVSDGQGGSDSKNITIRVVNRDTAINQPPVLHPIGNHTAYEGQTLQIRPVAADDEGDALTYQLILGTLPADASFDTATGYLEWTPGEYDGGKSRHATIIVSDGQGGADSEDITIKVTETNQDPAFDGTTHAYHAVHVGRQFTLDLNATDPDRPGQAVSYRILSQNPRTNPAVMDGQTGVITWTPNYPQIRTMTVQAGDDGRPGGSTTAAITVTVLPVPESALDAAGDIMPVNSTGAGTIHIIDVLANDIVPDGAIIESVTQPSVRVLRLRDLDPSLTHSELVGTTSIEGNRIIYREGHAHYNLGAEISFSYTLSNGITSDMADVKLLNGLIPLQSAEVSIIMPQDHIFRYTLDVPANVTLTVTDPPDHGNLTINGVTLTYAPNRGFADFDHYEFNMTFRGEDYTVRTAVLVNPFNYAPRFDPVRSYTISEGEMLQESITAQDANDPEFELAFSIARAPLGVQITKNSLIHPLNSPALAGTILTWTPAEDQDGRHTITLEVTDSDGASDSVDIMVTVNEANQNPVANNTSRTIDEDGSITIRPPADDPDGHPLTITSVTGATKGTTVRYKDILTYTPDRDQNGQEILTYTVSDGHGGTATGTITINITAVSDAPVLGALGDRSVHAQSLLDFTVTATDADGDDLTFAISDGPADATMTADGRFMWTPSDSDIDNHTIAVTVSDGTGRSDSEDITIHVVERSTVINQPPALHPIGNHTAYEGRMLQIQPGAVDDEGDALTYQLIPGTLPADVSFNTTTGHLEWTPGESDGGRSYHATVVVSDGQGGSDREDIAITVTETNQDPEFDDTMNTAQTAVVDWKMVTVLNATDSDRPAQNLTYELVGNPVGATISGNVISWTPQMSHAHRQVLLTARVHDDYDPPGYDDIDITVNPAEPAVVANDDAITGNGIETLTIDVLANDASNTNITIVNTTSDIPQDIAIPGEFGTISHNKTHLTYAPGELAPTLGIVGNFTYTVQGAFGNQDTADVAITIEPPVVRAVAVPTATGVAFTITSYSAEPITGRILDDSGRLIHTFYGIPPLADPRRPPTVNLVPDTGIPWIPGDTYTYQFARESDTGYAGSDVYSDTFVIREESGDDIAINVTEPVFEANDDLAVSNGTGRLIIDVLANDTFDIENGIEIVGMMPDDPAYNRSDAFGTISDNGTHVTYTLGSDAASSAMGTYTYTIQDGLGRRDSARLTITVVVPISAEPAILQTVDEGDAVNYMVPVHNPSGQNITWSFISGQRGDAAVSNAGLFTWTPTESDGGGTYRFDIGAEAATNTITHTVHVRVDKTNQNPVFVDVDPGRPAYAGWPYTLDLNATDGDIPVQDLTYSIVEPHPADAVIDPDSGLIRWTPDEPGTETIHAAVHDDHTPPGRAVIEIVVTVLEPLVRPPAAVDIKVNVTANHTVTINVPVDDSSGADPQNTTALGISISRQPSQGTVRINQENMTIIYRAFENATDSDMFNYTLTGDHNATATVTVMINQAYAPISFQDIEPQTVGEGGTVRYAIPVNNADGLNVIWSLTSGQRGDAMVDNTGLFTWTTTEEDGRDTPYEFGISATAGSTTISATLVVVVTETSPAPVARNITGPDGRITVIAPVSDTAVGSVLEAYMSRGLVVFGGILPVSGDISAIPAGAVRHHQLPGLAGDHTIGFLHAGIINATDTDRPGAGRNDAAALSVFINKIGNVPPVLSPVSDYSINAQDTLTFSVDATDFNDTVSYRLSSAPGNATISEQGIFRWMPGSADAGSHTFTITAHDGQNATDTQSVTTTVLPVGTPNAPPDAPDVTATVSPNGRVIIIPAISDPDGDPVRITGARGDAGGTIIPLDSSIEYIAGPALGTDTATYTVTDSRGAMSTGTIMITIRQ